MAVKDLIRLRLEKKIQKQDGDGCWLWTGATTRGYGVLAMPDYGKHRRAHVLMYELHNGPVPEGKVVCHKCNVKRCVRPSHLYAGTQAQNVLQAKQDGLILSREKQPKAKLSEEQVKLIRELMAGCPPSGSKSIELAKQFGVSRRNIRSITLNETWKD